MNHDAWNSFEPKRRRFIPQFMCQIQMDDVTKRNYFQKRWVSSEKVNQPAIMYVSKCLFMAFVLFLNHSFLCEKQSEINLFQVPNSYLCNGRSAYDTICANNNLNGKYQVTFHTGFQCINFSCLSLIVWSPFGPKLDILHWERFLCSHWVQICLQHFYSKKNHFIFTYLSSLYTNTNANCLLLFLICTLMVLLTKLCQKIIVEATFSQIVPNCFRFFHYNRRICVTVVNGEERKII